MKTNQQALKDVDSYILSFPLPVQDILNDIRHWIAKIVPEATERISYQIPTFYLNGNLVHYAAYEHHIGFYPGAAAIETFGDKLKSYKSGRGSVQFPIDKPMPFELIEAIVRFVVKQRLEKK